MNITLDSMGEWIDIRGWTTVEHGVLGIDEFPEDGHTFGAFLEGVDHILFEDSRDAMMFKLTLND